MIQPEPRPKKKQSRLAMVLIAGLTAVSLIGLLSIGLVLLNRTRSLTLAQARTRAAQWLPASAVFLRADEDEQETELNYHDPASGRDYELEIDRRDGELIEMHIERPNGQGAAITRLSIAEASAQVRQYFAQADPG